MPPSVKMDEGVEVRDEVEEPRKVGGIQSKLRIGRLESQVV